jgi:imidazolonepropionase
LITLRGAPGPRRGPALGQLQIIDDGAILVENGVIRDVGPTRRIENLAGVRQATELSAAGRVVMPGFVDSHTHLISGPSRLPDDGLPEPVRTNTASLIMANVPLVREATSRRLSTEAAQVLRQCVEYGTTTIEAKSGYGLNAGTELKILRVLAALGDGPMTVVPTFAAASEVPAEFEGRRSDYISWLSHELLPAVHKRGLARFVDGFCNPASFSAAELRPLYAAAYELGLPLKMSMAQFGPAEVGDLAGEFPFTSFDHLDYVNGSSAAAIAASGSMAVLTPASSFFLETPRSTLARDLIARGIPVALGSNFSRVTCPTYSMQLVMFLACRQMGMTAGEAVCAATLNSAYALKLGHRIGSLEVGKQADFLVLKVDDYRELVYEFGINLVDMTIRDGTIMNGRSGAQWLQAS